MYGGGDPSLVPIFKNLRGEWVLPGSKMVKNHDHFVHLSRYLSIYAVLDQIKRI